MKIVVTNSYEESSAVVADMFLAVYANKSDAKMGLATGSSGEPVYAKLVAANKAGTVDFSKARSVNLDEYVGLDGEHDQSYRYFMNTQLFEHINIDKNNTYVAKGTGNIEQNLKEFRAKISEGGGIDIQLLGIGPNGHIGFNEPNSEHLYALAHEETLTQATIDANARYFAKREDVPTTALTMGMGDIMSAKKIVLIATGAGKVNAIKGLICDDFVTTNNPASLLKLHSDATIVIDKALADAAGYKG